MPSCNKCNETFRNRVKINGEYKNICKRKYCLKCSPFGLHNTKKIHKIVNYSEKIKCKLCLKYNNGKRIKEGSICQSCRTIEGRKKKKIYLVNYMGGRCEGCDYSKCISALEFHHKNKKDKKFNISSNHSRSIEVLIKEADKCVLLCSNCHREAEEELRKLGA